MFDSLIGLHKQRQLMNRTEMLLTQTVQSLVINRNIINCSM